METDKNNNYSFSLKEGISDTMMAINMMESYGFRRSCKRC